MNSKCFVGSHIAKFIKTKNEKPNHRVVYTISIFADFYLDINEIELYGDK